MGTGSFLGVKSGRGVRLTPHPLLVPWSWKGRAIPLLPLWAVRPVQSLSPCTRVHFTPYKCHFINNAQGGKTAQWMMQSQWKLRQLQLKTWGSSTCVRYFPSVRRFELTSVRHGVCRRLGYCDSWRSKIVPQDWNFMWQKPDRNSHYFALSVQSWFILI